VCKVEPTVYEREHMRRVETDAHNQRRLRRCRTHAALDTLPPVVVREQSVDAKVQRGYTVALEHEPIRVHERARTEGEEKGREGAHSVKVARREGGMATASVSSTGCATRLSSANPRCTKTWSITCCHHRQQRLTGTGGEGEREREGEKGRLEVRMMGGRGKEEKAEGGGTSTRVKW